MLKTYMYSNYTVTKNGVELMCETVPVAGAGSVVAFLLVTNPEEEIKQLVPNTKIDVMQQNRRKKVTVIMQEPESESKSD